MTSQFVCVGCITGPQGIQGHVKVRAFTEDPFDVTAYGPLLNEEGVPLFNLRLMHQTKDAMVIGEIEGVTTRTQAELYKNTYLYVPRSRLPALKEEETYYHADLQGLTVRDLEGAPMGIVRDVHDFGAGILLEVIKEDLAESIFIPFRKDIVPTVDLSERVLHVDATVLKAFE